MAEKELTEPAKEGFVFLNNGDSHDFSRKQIRSRAAQHSHRIGPRKPKTSKKRRDESAASGSEDVASAAGAEAGAGAAGDRRKRTLPRRRQQSSSGTDQSSTPPTPTAHIGGYADEPFDAYPVAAKPWFPRILQYLWPFMLRGWSALPIASDDQQTALLWVQRLTMSEPTYFLMNMLSAAGDLAQRGQIDPSIVLWLNSEVVAALNLALSNPLTALNAATVLTVGRIALREIVVGDFETGKTVHRPAFARMIRMAGGLEALGLPPLVRLHLAWAESVMRKKTGVGIDELEPSLASEATFAQSREHREDKEVLDKYLPMRPPKDDGL